VVGVSVWQNHFGMRPQPIEVKQQWPHRAGPRGL
jgi:hypothetical protein